MKRPGSSQEQLESGAAKKFKSTGSSDSELTRLNTIIDELKAVAAKKEEEARTTSLIQGMQRAGEVLKSMEELLICPLCCEIMACPYSLPVASCGHSFCAICCLRWFFHYLEVDKTVVYHRSVDCPVCEAPLAEFSILDEWRERSTFPFIPNGLAVDAIDSHFLLFDSALKSGNSGQEGTESGNGEERGQGDADLPDLLGLDLKQTRIWKRGGEERLRWEGRARLGKEKMSMLEKMWALSPPEAFSQFKAELGSLGS